MDNKVFTSLVICLPLFFGLKGYGNDKGLLFYCDYDGKADATFAAGKGTASCSVPPEFQPGVRGQAIMIGGSPKSKQRIVDGEPKNSQKARIYTYSSDKNLNLTQGTISFWVKPLDWSGTDEGFNILFYTHADKNFFQIYKYWTDDRLLFLLGEQGKWTSAAYRLRDWKPGRWHHIVATWNHAGMRMYIDGHMVCKRKVRFPLKDGLKPLPFTVGGNAFIGHSLVDEFRIYDHPLSEQAITALYRKDASSVYLAADLITIGRKTPKQDGVISDLEYTFETCSGITPISMSSSMDKSRLAMSYDKNNLYIAIQSNPNFVDSKKSPGTPNPPTLRKVELLLVPESINAPIYSFLFEPSGKVTATKENDPGWHPSGIRVDNKIQKGNWTFETSIPFASLGVESPPNDKNWLMNIAFTYTNPARIISLAPVVGSVTDKSHFIRLVFQGSRIIRVGDWRNAFKQVAGLDVSVINVDKKAKIRYETVSDTTTDYGLRTTTFPLTMSENGAQYKSRSFNTTHGSDFSLSDKKLTEEIDGRKTILYRRQTIKEDPLPLKVFFLYTQQKKKLLVSLSRNAKEGEVQIRFLDKNNKCVLKSSQPFPQDASYFDAVFDLDFDVLKPAIYQLEVDYVAPDGKSQKIWEQAYRIPAPNAPDLQPYIDEEADVVPAPWTPIKVKKIGSDEIKVDTWGRSYTFSKNILCSSLVSQDEEILSAPMALRLNDKRLTPIGPVAVKDSTLTDISTEWVQETKLGVIDVANHIKVHFDGYCEVAMKFAPTSSTPSINSLSLDIPLRGSVARLVRDNRVNPIGGGKSGKVGDYWCQALKYTWGSHFWVGDNRVGFNWMAQNLNGWHSKHKTKQVELIRKDDTVVLRLNFVDHSFKLDKPTEISFGFTLTPSKPLDRKVLRRRACKDFQLWCQPWKYFAVPDYETADRKEIDKALAKIEPGANEVFLYLGVGLTSPFSPEWPWFAEEWRGEKKDFGKWSGHLRGPLRDKYTYLCGPINVDSFFNWVQNTRAKFFKKAKTPLTPEATGYYFDTGANTSDRYREQAINVYRMIKRTGPKARIMGHQGWLRTIPMQHFADILLGGEAVTSVIANGNYYDFLTPEMFRATFSPYIWGMKMIFLDLNVRMLVEHHPKKLINFDIKNPMYSRPILHSYGYCLAHDVDIHDQYKQSKPLREAIWAAQDQLGWDENVHFFPYWDNDAVKLVSPKSDRILASAYAKDGKTLLVVLNDTPEEHMIELELDLEKLGLKAGTPGYDVFEPSKKYAAAQSWQDTIPERGLRLVLFEKKD